MGMVRSPKSIAGAVEVALGNAPYKIGDRTGAVGATLGNAPYKIGDRTFWDRVGCMMMLGGCFYRYQARCSARYLDYL
jgi:hypothetical protein